MDGKLKNVFLHGGLTREEFQQIFPLVWERNIRILKLTALLSSLMAAAFLGVVALLGSGTWAPYALLLAGSAVVFALNRPVERSGNTSLQMLLCYGQMLLVCAYAGLLSAQPSNYAIPATSIVAFIALLPLTIDDRPLRMFTFMLLEAVSYLVVSRLFKSPAAFSLDVMNVLTFCGVGMALYAVICTRNIREIYQGQRIRRIQRSIITSMATVVEERDESTGEHISRTGNYIRLLTEAMKRTERYGDLPPEFYDNVLLAAPMHDIGKIKIPDAILNKRGKLTAEEYEIMKKHSEYGAAIIQRTMRGVEEEGYFEVARNIAHYHHERWDGTGYPSGLRGEKIPLEARMMALADVYDALVSERVYKKAFPVPTARKIVRDGCGTQFDPELGKLFLEAIA